MQTITLKTHADQDGMVTLVIPTNLAGREVEIVLVMQPLDAEPVDEMGYPLGYFENIWHVVKNGVRGRLTRSRYT
jgi:hypothetical protein